MQRRTQIRHKCHPTPFFQEGRQLEGPLCGRSPCPVQVGLSVRVKWQHCKFCMTAEAPLRETKWHQPVVVTHCCWQGDDEHLSLKGRSWAFPVREHVLVLMSKGKDRGWNRKPWGSKLWMISRTCQELLRDTTMHSEIHRSKIRGASLLGLEHSHGNCLNPVTSCQHCRCGSQHIKCGFMLLKAARQQEATSSTILRAHYGESLIRRERSSPTEIVSAPE